MGCGSSKMAAVVPSPQLRPQLPQSAHADGAQQERQNSSKSTGSRKSIKFRPNKISPKPVEECMSTPNVIKVQEAADTQHRNSNGSESDSSQYSSRESINSSSTRLISAHSTESKGSQDSGLGEEYSHVITEGSDSKEKEVAKVPQGMEKPDLIIEGEKIKTPSSVGHRQRPARLPPIQTSNGSPSSIKNSTPSVPIKRVMFSDSLIDELPDSPSIVKKPCAKGGLAFDIVLNDTPTDPYTVAKRKPAHLKKLEQKRGGNVSHKELDEKQKAAEQRRKACHISCYRSVASLATLKVQEPLCHFEAPKQLADILTSYVHVDVVVVIRVKGFPILSGWLPLNITDETWACH